MRWLGMALLAVLLTACGAPASAPAAVATQAGCTSADLASMQGWAGTILKEWDDAGSLAQNTPRIQLSDRIADLQRIRREAAAKSLPACVESTRGPLLAAMDAEIDAFTAFLGNQPDDVVTAKFNDAKAKQDAWETALRNLPLAH